MKASRTVVCLCVLVCVGDKGGDTKGGCGVAELQPGYVLESGKSDLVGKQMLRGHSFCMLVAADQIEALCDSNRVSSQKSPWKMPVMLSATTTAQHRRKTHSTKKMHNAKMHFYL